METLILLLVLAAFIGFCFWKYPALMKEMFSFKKKPVEPPAPPVSAEVVKIHDHSRSGGREHIGYINEPLQPPAAVKVPRHEIIKHDYKRSYTGEMWPRWTCKCGASDYEVTSSLTPVHKAEAAARKSGAAHIRNATEADRRLEATNGKFAF